jgi:organic radical activating enzyme
MKFPWHKYDEYPVERINTLQMFITNDCNLHCTGCFARNIMGDHESYMEYDEYEGAVIDAALKGCKRVTLIGGEPFLHPNITKFINFNKSIGLKTTIYTNGYYINRFKKEDLKGAKLRISLYYKEGRTKSLAQLPKTDIPYDICFMVSNSTTLEELVETANSVEKNHNCKVFFISSLRELDNPAQEFFDDTPLTMPVMDYKKLVHNFLEEYEGNMEIHISKRGVFESTVNLTGNKCKFVNYSIGGKIIQCPYDIVNLKFQPDYAFDKRYCQHNSTCLMSKIKLKRK